MTLGIKFHKFKLLTQVYSLDFTKHFNLSFNKSPFYRGYTFSLTILTWAVSITPLAPSFQLMQFDKEDRCHTRYLWPRY